MSNLAQSPNPKSPFSLELGGSVVGLLRQCDALPRTFFRPCNCMGGDPHFGSIHHSTRGRTFCPPLPQTLFLRLERAHGTGSGDGSGTVQNDSRTPGLRLSVGNQPFVTFKSDVVALSSPCKFQAVLEGYLNFYPVRSFHRPERVK